MVINVNLHARKMMLFPSKDLLLDLISVYYNLKGFIKGITHVNVSNP